MRISRPFFPTACGEILADNSVSFRSTQPMKITITYRIERMRSVVKMQAQLMDSTVAEREEEEAMEVVDLGEAVMAMDRRRVQVIIPMEAQMAEWVITTIMTKKVQAVAIELTLMATMVASSTILLDQ